MKTKILLTFATVLSVTLLSAQDIATFRVDNNYYSVVQTSKEYKFQEYSTRQGGKLLATKYVPANTEQFFIYPTKQRPAFYLHKKTSEYQQGDNTVIHLPKEEFVLEDIRLVREVEGAYLKWDCIVNDNIHFEIYQIRESVPVLVQEIQSTLFSEKEEYTSVVLDSKYAYVLKVVKNKSKQRYEHLISNLNGEPNIKVYPSVTSGKVDIDLGDMDFANYKVTAMNGQLIQEGKFYDINNSISIDAVSGIYIINIWNEQVNSSKRITITD